MFRYNFSYVNKLFGFKSIELEKLENILKNNETRNKFLNNIEESIDYISDYNLDNIVDNNQLNQDTIDRFETDYTNILSYMHEMNLLSNKFVRNQAAISNNNSNSDLNQNDRHAELSNLENENWDILNEIHENYTILKDTCTNLGNFYQVEFYDYLPVMSCPLELQSFFITSILLIILIILFCLLIYIFFFIKKKYKLINYFNLFKNFSLLILIFNIKIRILISMFL